MAKGYWITTYKSISDMSKVEAYAKLAVPAIEAHGGIYLARGIAVATYEAGIKERTVLSVFPSVDAAIAAHDSDGYAAALAALGDGAVREIRIVKGTS
jgi:uncharacterized protein (DUF1330 family)